MTNPNQAMRNDEGERFEAWARVQFAWKHGPFLRECNDPEPERTYHDYDVDLAWDAWQARAQQSDAMREAEHKWRRLAAQHISALISDLHASIDGGEECRGRDSQISGWICMAEKTRSAILAAPWNCNLSALLASPLVSGLVLEMAMLADEAEAIALPFGKEPSESPALHAIQVHQLTQRFIGLALRARQALTPFTGDMK